VEKTQIANVQVKSSELFFPGVHGINLIFPPFFLFKDIATLK